MHLEENANNLIILNYHYRLEIAPDRFRVSDPRTGHGLIEAPSPLVFWPSFYARDVTWRCTELRTAATSFGPITIDVTGEAKDSGFGPLKVSIHCFPEHLELTASCSANEPSRLAHWNLLGTGTMLDFFHIHHWRNRHGHHATYETYNLLHGSHIGEKLDSLVPSEMAEQWQRGIDLTTYSSDWHFTPRPSLIFLQRDHVMLGIGSRDLPRGFGLEMKAAARKLEHLRLNYGGEYGIDIAAGETIDAPRMYLWVDHHKSLWESVDHYVELLFEDGMIQRKTSRKIPHWWQRPIYCTWNDQGYLSGNAAYYNWVGESFVGKHPVEAFDAVMLTHLLDVIEREEIPLGSVIIDDGWQSVRGDWRAHPQKFPKLREQIERLHRMGLRVILWIAPLEFYPGCTAREHPEWLCGGGVLSKNNMPLIDYSKPQVQDEWVKPLLRYLLSDEEGCLNADGLKVDFMGDKVHPVFPIHDNTWRGEEVFIKKMMDLLNTGMKGYKSDAMMLGCTTHPFFIGCQDLIRTYDVPASQWQHADRCEMIRHFNPGNLVSLDLSETRSLADVEEHFAIALQYNMLFELSRIAPIPGTGDFVLGPEYYALLRRKLCAWS